MDTQQAPINPEVKKILAELCSFPLMNVHYQKYRLTLTVSVTSITSVNKSVVNKVVWDV